MTNTEIIANVLKARGMTDEQLSQLLNAHHGDLPFHTIPEWSRRGYHIKADAAPLFECYLWKHTNKPSRAAIEAAQEAGEDVPEKSPHFYKKLSYIYSFAQVEKNAAAPDLATIKARLQDLPGLTLTVKGEKTTCPMVWLTGDTTAHADAIKALGGIWSKKKSAYWVKPSAAPVPSMMEDAPAAPVVMPCTALVPAPCTALVPADYFKPAPVPAPQPVRAASHKKPAPKMVTYTVHVGKPVPQPWKKCSFYTIRRDKDDKKPTPHKVDGYTDGYFNYYAIGNKSKLWHAIHPVYGLSVASKETRQGAQALAMERLETVRKMEEKKDATPQAYADAIRAAQDGGNMSLF